MKDGELAPYQELIYLTAPATQEDARIAGERTRFTDLKAELLSHRAGTVPLQEWLRRRWDELSGSNC